jgi:hypothetical protein
MMNSVMLPSHVSFEGSITPTLYQTVASLKRLISSWIIALRQASMV